MVRHSMHGHLHSVLELGMSCIIRWRHPSCFSQIWKVPTENGFTWPQSLWFGLLLPNCNLALLETTRSDFGRFSKTTQKVTFVAILRTLSGMFRERFGSFWGRFYWLGSFTKVHWSLPSSSYQRSWFSIYSPTLCNRSAEHSILTMKNGRKST